MAGLELVDGTPCEVVSDDIAPGLRLTVTDTNGELIGTGALRSGVLAVEPNIDDRTVPFGPPTEREEFVYARADCVYGFTIPLMTEADFYTFALGTRDAVTYSHLELENLGWFLDLAP